MNQARHLTPGIDAGSKAVKLAVMESDSGQGGEILHRSLQRIRRRNVYELVHSMFEQACLAVGKEPHLHRGPTGPAASRDQRGGGAMVTGGLGQDVGLVRALRDSLDGKYDKRKLNTANVVPLEVKTHPDAVFAGAYGAALLGAFRYQQLKDREGAASHVAA